MSDVLLAIDGVTRQFGKKPSFLRPDPPSVHAVQGIDLIVRRGETLGIVGESGCGKSTLARMLVRLDRPSSGTITFDGEDLAAQRESPALARRIQYIFQDPISSLNPRKTIRQTLEAPLRHLLGMPAGERTDRLAELMDAVQLRADTLDRYPHEFSGGQAQRIAIARALAASPELIVLDEPVSALDVSVQSQVLKVLQELKERFDLTYVFISHDLAVVESVSDRVAVMYFGRIVEEAPAAALFRAPAHPYTRLLLSAAPVPGEKTMMGEDTIAELPDPLDPPPGCAFAPRCSRASEICGRAVPSLVPDQSGKVACHHPISGCE